ncbi:MAG: hypothetical protein ACOYJJ_00620 [Anaerovoracaceae bacterium]|jgi:uncharacterized alkaline shock family protein YloU
MTLMKTTDLGMITISNAVFARIIRDLMVDPKVSERIWPATRKGRLISLEGSETELSQNLKAGQTKDGGLELEFGVITKFGSSIRQLTKIVSDGIADELRTEFKETPLTITINIEGVRSRQVARRNTKVVYHYEAL